MITKLTIGSVTFNDNNNYFITGLSGLGMPPIRVANYDLAGEHFGVFVAAFYGKRGFSLVGSVVGSSVSDFLTKKEALQNALTIVNGEVPIYFDLSDGRQVLITAILTNLEFTVEAGVINSCEFNAQFEAAFPFLTDQTDSVANLKLPQGGGGEVPAPDMPMGLEMDSGSKIFVTNSGNAPYYPRARIYGPVTNPAIKNVTTGKELRLVGVLTTGQYLDIDFLRKTIVDQSGANKYSYKTGDWWFLQPGVNEITFTADTYSADSIIILYHRSAWLGI